MGRDISLSGGDISVIKALGLSGSTTDGGTLIERLKDMEPAELVDALSGLMMMDYILCDQQSLRKIEDVERGNFKVNPASMKDLKEALTPGRKEVGKPKRQRRG